MIIQKHTSNWYIASYHHNGKYYNGYGTTHAEAIINLIATLNKINI